MDDLSTRDEANETKFSALQRTLDMLVNGEGKKAMDCECRLAVLCCAVMLYIYMHP